MEKQKKKNKKQYKNKTKKQVPHKGENNPCSQSIANRLKVNILKTRKFDQTDN